MTKNSTLILDERKIGQKLDRIALQVLEQYHKEELVDVYGVTPRGPWVAERLTSRMKNLGFRIFSIDIKSENLHITPPPSGPTAKKALLIDDVLNTGSTMMKAATKLVEMGYEQIITACLVDRKHRLFPIKADFVGLTLATTIQEHISLDVENVQVFIE